LNSVQEIFIFFAITVKEEGEETYSSPEILLKIRHLRKLLHYYRQTI